MQLQASSSSSSSAIWRSLTSCTCTCSRPAVRRSSRFYFQTSARWQAVEEERPSPSQSTSTEYIYDGEDYHDPQQTSMLTARLAKTKKRILKRGQDFVDKIQIQVKAGKGGDGGVAFHREKFVERGPPSGGNGGHGGNVYIRAATQYSSLSHLKKTMLAHNGQAGAGSWLHGKRGNDLIIEVPYGTMVREIRESRRAATEDEDQDSSNNSNSSNRFATEEHEEGEENNGLNEKWSEWRKRIQYEHLSATEEEIKLKRSKMFVIYPALDEELELLDNKIIQDLELSFLEEERRELIHKATKPPITLDFDEKPEKDRPFDVSDPGMELNDEEKDLRPASADKVASKQDEKILLLRGGRGGYGNPYFSVPNSRKAPKLATRGRAGETMKLELELKTLADIGLVGFPNAGKSTLLQALTHSKSTVAPYAFTTLSPQIGTLIIYDDATYSTTTSTTPIAESIPKTAFESNGRLNRLARPALKDARQERLRLTIADCPGLLPRASDNVGLGHDFLRHIERSKVLVFIVDLSGKDPVKDVHVLKQELEDYKEGLSERARIIVANKADRVGENDPDSVQRMKDKLNGLKKLASEWEELDGLERKVIPMSARHRGNVNLLVDNLVDTLGVSSTNGDEED